jgi:hypothetical protein
MSKELLDHTADILSTPDKLLCADYHVLDNQALLAAITGASQRLRGQLAESVQPADVIATGFDNGWMIDPYMITLERWATHDTQAVRVAAKCELGTKTKVSDKIADHREGRMPWFGKGSERKRVRELAGLALRGQILIVREFGAEEFNGEKPVSDVMDAIRRDGWKEPDVVSGATTILEGSNATVRYVGNRRSEGNIYIVNGASLRFVHEYFYSMPGLGVITIPEDLEIVDRERFPEHPTPHGRALALQSAVHQRMHELNVIIGNLSNAAATLDLGNRFYPEGRQLQRPVTGDFAG